MNYEENSRKSKTYRNFRGSLHIGIGMLYLAIGGASIYFKKFFGTFELDLWITYLLGGLLLLYGLFRIWRGWRDMAIGKSGDK